MTFETMARRSVLQGAMALAGAAGLSACGDSSIAGDEGRTSDTGVTHSSAGSPSASAGPQVPTQSSYVVGRPDIPSHAPGIPPGYFHYPKSPADFITKPVGSGSRVSVRLPGSISVAKDKNKYWQRLDSVMSIDLELTPLPWSSYSKKLIVDVAGGDFADLTMMNGMPQLPGVLDKYCVDLSDWIAGDKVKEYPALAALPPTAWTGGTVNGRCYGVAQPRSAAGRCLSTRADILAKHGIDLGAVKDGSEFQALFKELSDPDAKQWAFGQNPGSWLVPGILEMMGAPNGWSDEDGRFTADVESEQYPDALDVVRKMWADKVLHPQSFAGGGTSGLTGWTSGATVFYYQAFEGWNTYQVRYPDLKFGVMVPPKWDGGGAAIKHLGRGSYADFMVMKKSSDTRVEELLRVLNYFAAPFGTQEYIDVAYGVKGHDYTLDGPDPVLTDLGSDETHLGLGYLGGAMYTVLYLPGHEDVVKAQHDYLATVIPSGIADASVGLYSETAESKGASWEQKMTGARSDIIQGRKPVSAWTSLVKDWKSAVGDTIRHEYEQAAQR